MRLIIILLLLLFSCQENNALKEKGNLSKLPTLVIEANTKNLTGKWIRKGYINSIKSNNSLYKAFLEYASKDFIQIIFDKSRITEFTMTSLHEGVPIPFLIKKDGSVIFFYIDEKGKQQPYGQIFLETTKNDTILNLKLYDQHDYISFLKSHEDFNTSLFSGNYHLFEMPIDSVFSTAIFKNTGKIEGFFNFTDFSPFFDYNDDIPQYDIIVFQGETETNKWFAWKKEGDDFLLYDFNDNHFDLNYDSKIGNLKYKLVKINSN